MTEKMACPSCGTITALEAVCEGCGAWLDGEGQAVYPPPDGREEDFEHESIEEEQEAEHAREEEASRESGHWYERVEGFGFFKRRREEG